MFSNNKIYHVFFVATAVSETIKGKIRTIFRGRKEKEEKDRQKSG